MVRIIDLSVPIEDSPSEPLPVRVGHEDHRQSVEVMKSFFGCTEQDLPQGSGWANDSVTMGAHAGTHVDAPWHYSPTSEGKRARTIDEMPLEWFYGDGHKMIMEVEGHMAFSKRAKTRPGALSDR